MTGREDATWAACLSMQPEPRNGEQLMLDVHLDLKITPVMIFRVGAICGSLPENSMSKYDPVTEGPSEGH